MKQKMWTPPLTTEFCIFELIKVSSFSLNWQFQFVGPNLPEKGVSGLKQKSEHHYWILHIRISLDNQVSAQTNNFDFLDQICSKKVFSV